MNLKDLGMWTVYETDEAGNRRFKTQYAGWSDLPTENTEFEPVDPQHLFAVKGGDGCHWGIDEPYPQLEELLKLALGTGQDFCTGWYSSKHEILSGRITRRGSLILCEASVSDDFDTEGLGEVELCVTGDEPVEPLYEEIQAALREANDLADSDREENEVYVGFSVHPVEPGGGGKIGGWLGTLILPKDGDTEFPPPGDNYYEWGWQDEDFGCPEETMKKLQRWAWSHVYGEPVGMAHLEDYWLIRAWGIDGYHPTVADLIDRNYIVVPRHDDEEV